MNMYGQPYFNNYNAQGYGYQPMYQQPMQQNLQQRPQSTEQHLQGRFVDSINAVSGIDYPLDGSISFFALTDGTAIVTKQLQNDGTSKTIIYKPIDKKEIENTEKYITEKELKEIMGKLDITDFKDDVKTLKRKMKELMEDIKDINEYINKVKEG